MPTPTAVAAMSEPTLFDPVTPPEPVGSLSRVPHFAEQFRAGRLTADAAVAAMAAEVALFVEQQRRIAAAHDAEVAGDREGRVRADARDTSAKAAAAITLKAGGQRARVLAFIVEGGGSTDYEIARDLRLLPNSVRPRRGELLAGAYVVDSGQRREHRGSQWVVWTATDAGNAWYARKAMGGAA